VNGIGARNGLGIPFESGTLGGQPFLVFVGEHNGADLGALSTTGTFVDVDIPCFLEDLRGEPSGSPFQRDDLALGDDLDVLMPADLDQYG